MYHVYVQHILHYIQWAHLFFGHLFTHLKNRNNNKLNQKIEPQDTQEHNLHKNKYSNIDDLQ